MPDKFSATVAYNLARLLPVAGLRRTMALALQFAGEEHTRTWLLNQIQGLLDPGKRVATVSSKHVRYSNGFYKRRGDTYELNMSVSGERRAQFDAAIESLVAEYGEEAVEVVAGPGPEGTAQPALTGQ